MNNEIFFSRELPWIDQLITVQSYGLEKASQIFPCQAEGFYTGCEAYKMIPAFLAVNGLVYFPFLLFGLFSWQHSERIRKTAQGAALALARWSVVVLATGLLALQVMPGLNLDTHDSLCPRQGMVYWHFGLWEQINDITGTLITIVGLLFPFYLYRAFCRGHGLSGVRPRLSHAASLAVTTLLAVLLGNVL